MAKKSPRPTVAPADKGKSSIVLPALKPRNAVQRAAMLKKAGEHGSTSKAQRKQANDALKKVRADESLD